jgi:hypothetical protein
MLRFFAGLRKILSIDYKRIVLGEIARDVINSVYIPRLEKKLKRADAGEREKLEELIKLYKKYGDRNTSDSRLYDNIAAKVVFSVAKSKGLSSDDAEQFAQDMANDFYTKNKIKDFDKFREEDGPLAFAKFWQAVISNQVKHAMRSYLNQQQGLVKKDRPSQDEFGSERSPVDTLAAPVAETDLDRKWMKTIYRDLLKYVRNYAKGRPTVVADTFEAWADAVKRKGDPDKVHMTKEIFNPLMDKKGHARGSISVAWKELKNAMVRFLEGEEIYLTDRAKKKLKLADSLAYDMFRRRLANWVLGK